MLGNLISNSLYGCNLDLYIKKFIIDFNVMYVDGPIVDFDDLYNELYFDLMNICNISMMVDMPYFSILRYRLLKPFIKAIYKEF